MTRNAITSNDLSPPVRPFAPTIEASGLNFISGQVAQDRHTGHLVEGPAEEQVRRILRHVDNLLHSAGRSLDDVVHVGVHLPDFADHPTVNRAYETFFREPYPTRTVIGGTVLALNVDVEIDAIAR